MSCYSSNNWKETSKSLSFVRSRGFGFWTFPNAVEWSLTPVNNPGRKTPATLVVDAGTTLNIKQGWHTVASMHVQDQCPSVNELPSTHITEPRGTCASPSAGRFLRQLCKWPESACSWRFSPPLTLHHHRLQPETCKPIATAHLDFWNTNSAKTIWPSMLQTHDFFFFPSNICWEEVLFLFDLLLMLCIKTYWHSNCCRLHKKMLNRELRMWTDFLCYSEILINWLLFFESKSQRFWPSETMPGPFVPQASFSNRFQVWDWISGLIDLWWLLPPFVEQFAHRHPRHHWSLPFKI